MDVPRETPHHRVSTVLADDFRQGPRYDNWRPRGTPDWLLILTVSGAGRVESGPVSLLTQPGTATLYQPGTAQRYFTDPETRRWHLLWAHFHPRPHWGGWLDWPEAARGLRRISLSGPLLTETRRALSEAAGHCRQPAGLDLAVNALERALLWMHSANNRRTYDDRIRNALDIMAEGLREPLDLPGLARACGLSVSRLAHLFREQVGLPPQQYLEELRLQRAAQLLRATGLRIGEIATETGYAGAFYFSARFRKKFGKSPSEYRKDR